MAYIHEIFLIKSGFKKIDNNGKYPEIGSVYNYTDEYSDLNYWFYELDDFVVNIHDFYIKKDLFFTFESNHDYGSHASINYIKTASADLLEPYRNISNNSIMTFFHKNENFKCLLHGGSAFYSVGFEYKDKYLDEYLPTKLEENSKDIEEAISSLNGLVSFTAIEDIANDIISYRDISPASKLFYEIKAREVLNIALERYYSLKREDDLSKDDETSLLRVAKYIDDHYVKELPLELLSEIAFMSKSKLKNCFKKRFNMTITEYTQRKRVSIAEHLILSTDLSIGNIAKSVGYNSHSRFSKLFKKYKGMHPNEFRQLVKKKDY
ncbi:MAG: AraC family transcriptional regulator [Tissierellia bacterium]|nr:AraC family transcriptional regulator [Tissierellia bacterium]